MKIFKLGIIGGCGESYVFSIPFALFGACHYNHYIIVLQKGCLTRQSVEQKVYARRVPFLVAMMWNDAGLVRERLPRTGSGSV